ncbi:MAG TPA: exodeoxyribonuclease V subunit gamma, partial [Pirellulaceae bacterium]|nr:exodeoxyribonuclease V subunit gamma [Pirellulaceae bacterium]
WQRSLSAVLSRFAAVGTDLVDEWRAVQATINTLHANMLRAGSRSRLPLAVVRKALNDLLDDRGAGAAPGGGVTFSSLVGLRGLPYCVVCLLGMNDGVFPSSEAPCEFDLMALAPQPADRQRRLDERNLFLDLVLAARQRLYLSYSGRNRRDNRVVPPSVLVAELLDYVAVACAAEPGNPDSVDAVRRRLTVEHPLQPFARDYFLADGDARRRSFNREYALALQGAEKTPLPAATVPVDAGDDETTEETIDEAALPFFTGPLDPPCAEWRQVSGEQLQRFYRNPCRTLLAGRLNLSLASDDEELSDEEPFLPDYPERRSLAHRLLPVLLAGGDPSTLRTLAMAGNEFPRGSLGERLLDLELAHLRRFADDLRSRLVTPALPEVPIALATEIAGETWQLTTTLVDLRADGLLRYRYDELRATDYLAGWIEHLLLCAQPPEGVCLQTRWLARAGGYQLQACSPAVARALIDELLRFYRQGLSEPLPFYPKSAWDYLDGGLIAARRRWRNDRQ